MNINSIPVGNEFSNIATMNYYYSPVSGGVNLNFLVQSNITVFDVRNFDYGDAPDKGVGNGPSNYSTLLSNNGPRHGIIPSLILGNNITAETNAYQNYTATGDDILLGVQDDGPTVLPLIAMNYNATSYVFNMRVTNTTGGSANLYVWLDFNQNGIFETNESFVSNIPSIAGIQIIQVVLNKPVGYPNLIGRTFIRARLTTETLNNTGGPTSQDTRSIGSACDGEVEDYLLNITNSNFLCSVTAYKVYS